MTARERTKKCLNFTHPDRPPRDLWLLPYVAVHQKNESEALLQRYPMDIQTCKLEPEENKLLSNVGRYTDKWGSVWYISEAGFCGEVKEPVLSEWSRLDKFRPPWHLIQSRDFSQINKLCEENDKFMLSDVTARPFERMQFLRGAENIYIDIAYGTAEFRRLLEMIHQFYLEDIKGWCESNVDAIFFMDDWGTNNSLVINPETWREIFKPLYREYCDIIHRSGKFAFFHSDGYIEPIYGDLIEIGIDAINSQLFVMNIEDLARKYKGKITFWGEIDRQYTLPFGGIEEIRRAVMRLRRAFDDGNGGVIAQCEWGKDNSRENIDAVYEAWTEPID